MFGAALPEFAGGYPVDIGPDFLSDCGHVQTQFIRLLPVYDDFDLRQPFGEVHLRFGGAGNFLFDQVDDALGGGAHEVPVFTAKGDFYR